MGFYPRDLVPLTHTFFNTLYKHYRNETPESTWDLKLHLSVELLRCLLQHSKHKTIEAHQKFTANTYFPVPSSILIHKTTIPETSRSQAEDILAGLLSGQEDSIGWRWREDPMRQKPLKAEWIEEKRRKQTCDVDRVILYVHGGAYCVGSPAQSRFLVNKVVKAAAARAISVDYRLAPQSPFPAAVIDTLAAYLYLIQPPANSGLNPINPSNIVIMGDSAGGGLSLAVMLLLRDAGLPQPAACVCWSPWVDLYHSLPSVLENSATDYLPNGIVHKPSPANPIKDYKNFQERLSRIQYYAYNSALNCPYVSPLLAKDLGGLGQVYITCGNAERLRDEAILFAYKASKTCSDVFEVEDTSDQHEHEPTKVTLHVYDAMPHVFQVFSFHPAATDAISRTASFIRKVIPSRPSSPGNVSPERRSNDSNDLPSLLYGAEINFNNTREDKDEGEDEDENEDEFVSEDELMLIKRMSVNVKSREFEGMEKSKLKEWIDALGKLPEFAKNPEIFERLLNI